MRLQQSDHTTTIFSETIQGTDLNTNYPSASHAHKCLESHNLENTADDSDGWIIHYVQEKPSECTSLQQNRMKPTVPTLIAVRES